MTTADVTKATRYRTAKARKGERRVDIGGPSYWWGSRSPGRGHTRTAGTRAGPSARREYPPIVGPEALPMLPAGAFPAFVQNNGRSVVAAEPAEVVQAS